jgi:hypothetical protein
VEAKDGKRKIKRNITAASSEKNFLNVFEKN